MDEYNCFKECNHTTCPSYFGMKEEPKCIYKNVAKNDLQKFKDGRTGLTLIDMLEKYLNIKVEPKELQRKETKVS